jgi:hypothetical protein
MALISRWVLRGGCCLTGDPERDALGVFIKENPS